MKQELVQIWIFLSASKKRLLAIWDLLRKLQLQLSLGSGLAEHVIIVIRREENVTGEGLVLIALVSLSSTNFLFKFLSHIIHKLLTTSIGTRSFCDYKRQPKKRGKLPSAPSKIQSQEPTQSQMRGSSTELAITPGINRNVNSSSPNHHRHNVEEDVNGELVAINIPRAADIPEPFSSPSLNMMMDDYQMFNLDANWSMGDLGGDFEQDVVFPILDALQNASDGSAATALTPEALGSSGAFDSLNRHKSKDESSGRDTGRQVTYGIHSFRSIDENANSAFTSTQRLPQVSRFQNLSISRSGDLPKPRGNISIDQRRSSDTSTQTGTGLQEQKMIQGYATQFSMKHSNFCVPPFPTRYLSIFLRHTSEYLLRQLYIWSPAYLRRFIGDIHFFKVNSLVGVAMSCLLA